MTRAGVLRDLSHIFVALMPTDSVPIEGIARVVGTTVPRLLNSSTGMNIGPVIATGAEVIDWILSVIPGKCSSRAGRLRLTLGCRQSQTARLSALHLRER